MIEQTLFFALGFVTAALLALVILPAFWRRAYRLTRRELEATLPLSPSEIAAERDQLRAKFAVERVQLEQTAEKAQALRQAVLSDSGAKSLRITDLEDRITSRDASIAALETKAASLEAALVNARGVIEEQRAAIGSLQHEAKGAEAQLAALTGEHRDLGDVSDSRRIQIAALETNLEAQRARIGELDRDLKAARAQARSLTEEVRARERSVRDLEKELSVAVSKQQSAEEIAERRQQVIAERDAAVGALEEKLDAARREARSRDDIIRRETRRAEVADKLALERDAIVQKLKDEARVTTADLAKSADKLKADRQKLQAELTEVRGRAAQLQREVNALKRGTAAKVADLRPKQAGART
ncbi:MAG: hypothetical protein ACRCTI_18085 [Beijerinckiaceae bacterium]